MKLGIVKAVRTQGVRVLLRVLADEVVYDDVVLVHALHQRSRVQPGSRVVVGYIDGEDTTVLAWPIEFATQADDVIIHRDDGISIRLAEGKVEIIAPDVRIGATPDALVAPVNGVVLAHGVDPFTGATYGALGNASNKVLAEK